MLDTLSPQSIELLSASVVYPIYLVEIGYGDNSYLSTSETVSFDDKLWIGSEVIVDSSTNWESASIIIDNFDGRYTASANAGEWRGAICRVYLGVFKPQFHEEGRYAEKGYVKTGYVKTEYTTPSEVLESVLLFDGELTSANDINAYISLGATRPQMTSLFSPRVRIDKPIFNHIPPAGTVISWNGDTLELVR